MICCDRRRGSATRNARSGPCCAQLSRRRPPRRLLTFRALTLPGRLVLNQRLIRSTGRLKRPSSLSTVCTFRPLPQDTQHDFSWCSRCGEWGQAQPEAWPIHDWQGGCIRVRRAALCVPLLLPPLCATQQLIMVQTWAGQLQQSAAPLGGAAGTCPPAAGRPECRRLPAL